MMQSRKVKNILYIIFCLENEYFVVGVSYFSAYSKPTERFIYLRDLKNSTDDPRFLNP